MKLITDDILELVAGGYDSQSTMQSVSIIGYPDPPQDPYPDPPPQENPWPNGPPPIWQPDPTVGTGGSPPQQDLPPCQVHSSPAPSMTPAGVDLNTLRNQVEQAAKQIMGMNKDVEHGVLWLRTPSGQIVQSSIVDGTNTGFNMSFNPQEGTLVAYLHSHPATPGVDETLPSWPGHQADDGPADTTVAQGLISNGYADPGGLMYILDDASGHTFEYTMGGGDQQRARGADISADHPACA
jgi:hypothetical protein